MSQEYLLTLQDLGSPFIRFSNGWQERWWTGSSSSLWCFFFFFKGCFLKWGLPMWLNDFQSHKSFNSSRYRELLWKTRLSSFLYFSLQNKKYFHGHVKLQYEKILHYLSLSIFRPKINPSISWKFVSNKIRWAGSSLCLLDIVHGSVHHCLPHCRCCHGDR